MTILLLLLTAYLLLNCTKRKKTIRRKVYCSAPTLRTGKGSSKKEVSPQPPDNPTPVDTPAIALDDTQAEDPQQQTQKDEPAKTMDSKRSAKTAALPTIATTSTPGTPEQKRKKPSQVSVVVTQKADVADPPKDASDKPGVEPEFLPSDHDDDTLRCVKSIRKN